MVGCALALGDGMRAALPITLRVQWSPHRLAGNEGLALKQKIRSKEKLPVRHRCGIAKIPFLRPLLSATASLSLPFALNQEVLGSSR